MANPKAVIVVGPESSGNRLMTKLLVLSGCDGDGEQEQRFDEYVPEAADRNIVWLMSVPLGSIQRPDLNYRAKSLQDKGYEVSAIVMARDWFPTHRSQMFFMKIEHFEAVERIRRAYLHIFRQLDICCVPFVMATYESLLMNKEKTMKMILDMLELPHGDIDKAGEIIFDANEKYYDWKEEGENEKT